MQESSTIPEGGAPRRASPLPGAIKTEGDMARADEDASLVGGVHTDECAIDVSAIL